MRGAPLIVAESLLAAPFFIPNRPESLSLGKFFAGTIDMSALLFDNECGFF
jgi:hypothetical protein